MEPLKNMFSPAFVKMLADQIRQVHPSFETHAFNKEVNAVLPSLELNSRMRIISSKLADYLPDDFDAAVSILGKVIPKMPPGYTNLVFPDFVGLMGKGDFERSMQALRDFTQYGSSEFAIREFLKQDLNKTLNIMKRWASDPNEHVRRLASEGSRPRLPWSFKLEAIIKQPELTFPVLDALQRDNSLYVRKSVGNHLNDISKDQPEKMLAFIRDWDMDHPHSAWIAKRACRNLIKQGDTSTLRFFGFEKKPEFRLLSLNLSPAHLKIGGQMLFSFTLLSEKRSRQRLVVDYRIHHLNSKGQALPKVYKLKELWLEPALRTPLRKTHAFKQYSTRKQFPGKQRLDILVNGSVVVSRPFMLHEG